ncbi:MAG: GDP-mannose 4,6-dehydratase [Dehalococcoidales bacterium]|nr:GDP-mannose 4,6-dehydratase [Dehalococcoidales bacterium]
MDILNSFKDKTVLITGISGFVGSWLAETLCDVADVHGLYRYKSKDNLGNIEHIKNKITLVTGDIRDSERVFEIVKFVQPDYIFHLAAHSLVMPSFESPSETYFHNISGTINMLLASNSYGKSRMHFASTSEVYGNVKRNGEPINENDPLMPASPYGASKAACDIICRTHAKCYGTDVVVTRAFNHGGVRRGEAFVTSVIAKQIADILLMKTEYMSIGNLHARRDFTDVRDMIKAYMLTMIKGESGEVYNIGTGKSVSIKELIMLTKDVVEEKYNRTLNFQIVVEDGRIRPLDVDALCCDNARIRNLGWMPVIPLKKTMLDMVEYYLAQSEKR